EVRKDFLLVPDVVAGSQDSDAQAEQFLDQGGRDPKARGGVFPIRQNQVRRILLHQPRQDFLDRATARLTEDVPNKENFAGHKAPAAECPQVTSLSIITEQPAQPCDPRDSNLIIEVGALRLPLGLKLCGAKPLAHRKSELGSLLDGVGSNNRRVSTCLAGLTP